MVAVSWITIATGLILTIVFIAIMYFFFVSFRVSVKAFVDSFISTFTSSVQDYRSGITNAIKRIPGTIGLAICLLVGTTFDPSKPTCPTPCGPLS
jgi:Na+(H+)/acetate symporter ActP